MGLKLSSESSPRGCLRPRLVHEKSLRHGPPKHQAAAEPPHQAPEIQTTRDEVTEVTMGTVRYFSGETGT